MKKLKLPFVSLLAFAVMFSCEESESFQSPVGDWQYRYYLSKGGENVTIDTFALEIDKNTTQFLEITDSEIITHTLSYGFNGYMLSAYPARCEISEKIIRQIDPLNSSRVTEMEYYFSGDTLLLQSPSYPEGYLAFRIYLIPYFGGLPPAIDTLSST